MEISQISSGAAGGGDNALSGLSANLDNFLKILTTQLKFQDPLDPLDTNEFTNQLVLFTQVEQQVQQNQKLDQLITLQQNNVALGAVSYIGNTIEASGQTTRLEDSSARFSYFLAKNADRATLRISDSNNDTVVIQSVLNESGIHDFVWDGRDGQGNQLDDGTYTFTVSAFDRSDKPIAVDHTVFGRVTGIQFDNGNAILTMGDILVPLSQVNGVALPPDPQG